MPLILRWIFTVGSIFLRLRKPSMNYVPELEVIAPENAKKFFYVDYF